MAPIDVKRVPVREGYDLWSQSYDHTPNPVVAMDELRTLDLLNAVPGERILDAGCGTGRNLRRLAALGARAYGLDFSAGMLKVARDKVPEAPVFLADLQASFPLRDQSFSAVLCALIGEHLDALRFTFCELFRVLRPGGRLVFSAYHPELAEEGKEANFELDGIEYRLGAIRYGVDDYLAMAAEAGFHSIEGFEFLGDDRLVSLIPSAQEFLGRRVIFALRAVR